MGFSPDVRTGDRKGILCKLRDERIQFLYHFTSVENLPHIARCGALYSKARLEAEHLRPPQPGGNADSRNMDRRIGNWDKVCLGFTPYLPMAYHKKREMHLCYFMVDPRVATEAGVMFTDRNAVANAQNRGTGISGLSQVDFTTVRFEHPRTPADWKSKVQAEVLVPGCVPLELVQYIAFVSPASLEEGLRLWGNASRPEFAVRPELFVDNPHVPPTDLRLARIERAVVGGPIARHSLGIPVDVPVRIERSYRGHVHVAVEVATGHTPTPGTVLLEFAWTHGRLRRWELKQRWRGIIEDRVFTEELTGGQASVEVRLNGIRWCRLPFELNKRYAF